MESLCRFGPEIPDRGAESLSESPDIVLCSLQTVQEGEESVAGFVATRRSIRRGCLGECFLLHGKCRFVHEDETIGRLDDYRPKNVPRMSQRLVDTSFGNFNGRDVAEARVQQNDAQNLLVEKLHIRAGSID